MNAQINTKTYVENSMSGKAAPEIKFRAGAISAAVWPNKGQSKTGEETEFKTVSLQRSYKDKNDQWQNTSQLRISDLPKAALILSKAYEYLVLNQQFGSGSIEM